MNKINTIGKLQALSFKELEHMADAIPAPLYWLNTEGIVLGANQMAFLKITGSNDPEIRKIIIGKRHEDFYPKDIAKQLDKNNRQVIESGKAIEFEEKIVNPVSGQEQYFAVVRAPMLNLEGKIIGVIGTSVEIMKISLAQIFTQLDRIANFIPSLFYWLDTDGVVLGLNDLTCIELGGLEVRDKIVGKRHEDFYPEYVAKRLNEHNRKVLESGSSIEFEEEVVNIVTGQTQFYAAVRAPWWDDDGNIIGIVGTSIDITDKKEKERLEFENERLRLENKAKQTLVEEQEKFKKAADQVAHDIRSPIATLLMIVGACQGIEEPQRVALREAANRINDIANNLISRYQKKNGEAGDEANQRQSILVSTTILQILTEQKYRHQELPVKLDHHFSQTGNFAWIRIQPDAFKRMLANIINNAVDAFEQKTGNVMVHLDASEDQVRIVIEDNGKGMPPELLEKISNKIAVTQGKPDGHGIGLTQVYDTLDQNEGKLEVESEVGVGTKIILIFPRVKAQKWLAESIQLYHDDTVIILDDDSSIHWAWDFRFEQLKKEHPNLTIIHHEKGQDTLDFMNPLSPEEKQKIFLLSDYELIQQGMNGLEVIAKTQSTRSVLVTSHYAHQKIQESAEKTNTKILPKQLAAEIPMQVHSRAQLNVFNESRKVDIVFIDDEQSLLNAYQFFTGNIQTDTFLNPNDFLNQVNNYSKNTKIMLDQNFSNSELTGVQIAEQLHQMGFTHLYLLTGENIADIEAPSYLTLIMKSNIEILAKIINL